ncbi:MAG: N-acetylmuramoyl-L-alanine amidase [Gammaproteobacteria bacterium]|nr:N-acetylmuramoyl-L-alanine amidase [Gammaproteobacteria bacterium]MDH5801916.1 N-acetylmuramoyl-L-alanine amidase [Gammaproteobacteria bacterium]
MSGWNRKPRRPQNLIDPQDRRSQNRRSQNISSDARDQILQQLYENNVSIDLDANSGLRPKPKPYPAFSYRNNNSTFWLLMAAVLVATVYTGVIITQWELPFDQNLLDVAWEQSEADAHIKTGLETKHSESVKTVQMQDGPSVTDAVSPYPNVPVPGLNTEEHEQAMDHLESLSSPGVPLAHLFGLGVSTIVIDPGHGGKDPGATGKLGTFEKDIALAIALELRDRLQARGEYNVLMTRDADTFVSLSQRVAFANANNADLFISIHVNYFPGEQVNFVETFYFGPNKDKTVEALALRENADSHYNFGDFKAMVKKVSDTMKFQESRELAQSVQENLFAYAKKVNRKARDHGIKPAPFVVLLGIDAPSILTEVASINSEQEEWRLKSSVYRDKIAKFLEKGIVNYLNKTITLGSGGGSNGEEKENLAQAKKHKQRPGKEKP